MSHVKFSKNDTWKTELEQLADVPGGKPDMGMLWDKLECRLQVNKKNRKRTWYRFAAAAVLVSAVATWVMINTKQEKNIQPAFQHQKLKHQTEAGKTMLATGIPLLKNDEPIRKTIPHTVGAKKSFLKPALNQVGDAIAAVTEIEMGKDSLKEPHIITLPVKPRLLVFTTLRKKLPVVHINDLDKPLPVIESLAGNNDRPAFRLRLFSRDISPLSPGSAINDNEVVLKIKLSPQN